MPSFNRLMSPKVVVDHFEGLSNEPMLPNWTSWSVHEVRNVIVGSEYAQKIVLCLTGYVHNQLEVCDIALSQSLHAAHKLLS